VGDSGGRGAGNAVGQDAGMRWPGVGERGGRGAGNALAEDRRRSSAGRAPKLAACYVPRGSGGSGEPATIAIGLLGSGDPMTEDGSGGSGEVWRMRLMTFS
jgi:hypothetical protein